ncbi:hypothetical protein ACKVWC_005760 [Pyricularia oryzae]
MTAQSEKDHQYFASPGEAVALQSPAGPIHSHYCYSPQEQEESLRVVIQAQVQVPDQTVEAVEVQASVPEAEVVGFVV